MTPQTQVISADSFRVEAQEFLIKNGEIPTDTEQTKFTSSPEPAEDCFYGLAGDFVRLVEPHTESDNMSLLSQFLAYFGNIVGRCAYYKVEGDPHYTNIFCLLVGNTVSGRKGTSFGRVKEVFRGLVTNIREIV